MRKYLLCSVVIAALLPVAVYGAQLSNGSITAQFSDTTGAITSVTIDAVSCITGITDSYEWGATTSDESTDIVGSQVSGPNEITYTCSNPSFTGLTITKNYILDANELRETTTYAPADNSLISNTFKITSAATLGASFRQKGYYYRPIFKGAHAAGHSGSRPPLTAAPQITSNEILGIGHNSLGIIIDPNDGIGLAHYKSKVNSDWVFPHSKLNGYFTSTGWDIGITFAYLKQAEPLVVEVLLRSFGADARGFNKGFVADQPKLPAHSTPGWFSKVKYLAQGPEINQLLDPNSGLASIRSEDRYLQNSQNQMSIVSGWQSDGYYPSTSVNEPALFPFAGGPNEILEEDMIAAFGNLAAVSAQTKTALYTSMSGTYQTSPIVTDHGDWLLRDALGAPIVHGGGNTPNYFLNFEEPNLVTFFLNQFENQITVYGSDFLYTDTAPDSENEDAWNKNVHHHFWKFLRDVSQRAVDNNAILFANGGNANPFTDGGFFELGGLSWGPLDANDWRSIADGAYISKLTRNEPGRWLSPLFWSTVPDDRDTYANRILLYGLKPSWTTNGPYLRGIIHQLVVSDLAYETRDFYIPDGPDLSPCWQKLETQTLESSLLKHINSQTYLAGLVRHGPAGPNEIVTLKDLPYGIGNPVYMWRVIPDLNVFVLNDLPPNQVPTLSLEGFQVLTAAQQLNVTVSGLKPNELNFLVLSEDPVFIYSANSIRKNFLLPQTDEITVNVTSNTPASLAFDVSAQTAGQILAYYPHWPAAVVVNGQAGSIERLQLNGTEFLLISVPAGNYSVAFSQGGGGGGSVGQLTSATVDVVDAEAKSWNIRTPDTMQITAAQKAGKRAWRFDYSGGGQPAVADQIFGVGTFGANDGLSFWVYSETATGQFLAVKLAALPTLLYPLDFVGWKEIVVRKEEFGGTVDEATWANLWSMSFTVAGVAETFYIADLRFLPLPKLTINTTANDGKVTSWSRSTTDATWNPRTVQPGTNARQLVLASDLVNSDIGVDNLYVADANAAYRVWLDEFNDVLVAELINSTVGLGGGFSIAVGDADNDGITEVIMGDDFGVRKHQWNGFTWVSSTIKDTGGPGNPVPALAIGETNNDGKNEIMASWTSTGLVAAYEYDGVTPPAGYVEDFRGTLGSLAHQAKGGDVDINGDGTNDFVIVADQKVSKVDFDTGGLQVIHNNGHINTSVAIGYVDDNALLDVVVVTQAGHMIYYEYTDPNTYPTANPNDLHWIVPAGQNNSNFTGVDVYDIDQDGMDEIITVSDGGEIRRYDYKKSNATWIETVIVSDANFSFTDVVVGSLARSCDYFLAGDISKNCYVDLFDLVLFVSDWMKCTDPGNINCN